MSLETKIKARDIAHTIADYDAASFALKNASKYEPELLRAIASHLDFLSTIKKKIPGWAKNKELIAHLGINLEQSSSEKTAMLKANYVSGKNGVDLTGGLGVDSYFLAQKFIHFTHNEPSSELSEVVRFNFNKLGNTNTQFTQFKAEDFEWDSNVYDWAYLDPSRRSKENNKLFKIEDCLPNLVEIKEKILAHASAIMVKYSPMLDIKLAINNLKTVEKILVISEKNEVKELVFIITNTSSVSPLITCINLESSQEDFTFSLEEEANASVTYSDPLQYLYEPNAAVLKAGAFQLISSKFNIKKLAPNSHLYTSTDLISHFPGRIFKINTVTNYDKKRLKSIISQDKANVSTRNFPAKPDEIKKQLKWKDGGDDYVFFTQNIQNKKLVIFTQKI